MAGFFYSFQFKYTSLVLELLHMHILSYKVQIVCVYVFNIYPTPPLGQDMTQGQFLSGV